MRELRFYLRTLMAQHSDRTGERLTYDTLNEATGISPNTLSRMATNQQSRFDKDVLERLCDFFGCELHDLLHLEDVAHVTSDDGSLIYDEPKPEYQVLHES